MDVLFCMKDMEKNDFMMLPGVEELLRGFRSDHVWWLFKKFERTDQEGKRSAVSDIRDREMKIILMVWRWY